MPSGPRIIGKCAYCGASQKTLDRGEGLETHAYAFIHTDDINARVAELFGDDMQFDVIIGNPPFQLDDGGFGSSAAPIYNRFVDQAKKLNPRLLAMIIPSRWFAGGKGLDEFRESMLTDDRHRSIDDYLNASDVFPEIGLKGGVCYFLWDRDNPGPCRVTTHFKGSPPSAVSRRLLEVGADVFIRFNEGLSILKKVVAVETGQPDSLSMPEGKHFDRLVSSLRPFGLRTYFGDGTRPELLRAAGIANVSILVIAIDNQENALRILESVRAEHPHVKVFARAFDRVHAYKLKNAGAHSVVIETGGSAVDMGVEVLKALGYSSYRAVRQGGFFHRRNRQSIEDMAPIYAKSERNDFVREARQRIELLEGLLKAESTRQSVDDSAWETAPPKAP